MDFRHVSDSSDKEFGSIYFIKNKGLFMFRMILVLMKYPIILYIAVFIEYHLREWPHFITTLGIFVLITKKKLLLEERSSFFQRWSWIVVKHVSRNEIQQIWGSPLVNIKNDNYSSWWLLSILPSALLAYTTTEQCSALTNFSAFDYALIMFLYGKWKRKSVVQLPFLQIQI